MIPTKSDPSISNGLCPTNSAKCNEDHLNDKGDEIPKGTSITHNYIKRRSQYIFLFDIQVARELCGLVQIRSFRIS